MSGSISGMRALIAAALLAGAAAAVAVPLPEPALRLSPLLATKARPAGTDERAVLRLEWKAGQFRADETGVVAEILERVDRMGHTVAELRVAIEAIPSPSVIAADNGARQAVDADEPLPWLPLAGAAAALLLAGVFWAQRRRRPSAAAFAPTIAAPAPAPAPKHRKAAVPQPPPVTPPPPPAAVAAPPVEPAVPPPAAFEPRPIAEVDEALELVDIMISMGLNQGAAQTLEEHVRRHPRQALYHWLKLLDVYRRSGLEAEFERAAGELRQNFNILPANWRHEGPALDLSSVEDYPHIVARLLELWRTPACEDYLTRLLEDNRGGTRAGFPQPVAEELLFLLSLVRNG